jgi:hypothetical protein
MRPLRARVIVDTCGDCRAALLLDCQRFELPPPSDEIFLVPETWAEHRCNHLENGFVLEFPSESDSTEDISEALAEEESPEAVNSPWRDTLDATKNIGYPARESGRYGSHPAHDGFDDESEP